MRRAQVRPPFFAAGRDMTELLAVSPTDPALLGAAVYLAPAAWRIAS